MRRFAAVLAVLAAITGGALFAALPAGADVSPQDVEDARLALREVNTRLSDQVAQYDRAVMREGELRIRLDGVLVDLATRERELVMARAAARDRVADMYMSAGTVDASGPLAVRDFAQVPAKKAYLDTVAETDREVVTALDAARLGFERQQALLEEIVGEQEEINIELESLVGGIYAELEDANSEYQSVKAEWNRQEEERKRREEEERLRQLWLATSTTSTLAATTTTGSGPTTTEGGGTTTTEGGGSTTTSEAPQTTTTEPPPPPSPGKRVCPVDGAVTFRDSWGECRDGCSRRHTGTDMTAAKGTPLVAVEDGYIWYMSYHYAGGNGLYIQGDSGDRWYYAHLDSYASGIKTGVKVTAGQLVGRVGETGNARNPHLHIAYLPGGASYANPYPIMAKVC